MTAGHPEGLPDLFLDRSLGRRQVPGLLRAAGLRLRTLAEVYGVPDDESVEDVAWLAYAGDRHWPVLMKDERIRYRIGRGRPEPGLRPHHRRRTLPPAAVRDARSAAHPR